MPQFKRKIKSTTRKLKMEQSPFLVRSTIPENKPEKSLLIVEPSFEKAPSSSSSGIVIDFSETSSTLTKFRIPLSSMAKWALMPLLSALSIACLTKASETPVKDILEIFVLPTAL